MKRFDDKEWEVDYILPPKKSTGKFKNDTEAVLVEIAPISDDEPVVGSIPPKEQHKSTYNKATQKYEARPVCSYTPENPFIKNVTVWLWPSKFTFYERFHSDAERNFDKVYVECEHVKFFSYMPQYIQLETAQFNWYLWWRENVRKGKYLPTDFSYILLYVYEIINLPERIPAEKGIALMCDIWLAYRDTYSSKLDRHMIEWICDYCLINQLSPPYDKFNDEIMNVIKQLAGFKEFFIKVDEANLDPYYSMLMYTSTNYDWTKSKYVTDENRELFREHITQAFQHAARQHITTDHMTDSKMTRDAYSGSLCAYNVKRRIDVDYRTFTRSAELRLVVSDLIKYAENKVRAMIGIKGRLSTPNLKDEMTASLEQYFDQFKTVRKKPKTDEAENEYSHLYEARSSELSTESALAIEQESWSITNTLVDALVETDTYIEPEPEIIESEPEQTETSNDIILAIKYIYHNEREKFNELVKRNNMLDDTMIECINEYVYDIIGDIAIEVNDDWYMIIEDYTKEMEDLINGRSAEGA
jgi:hypothetical protein